MTMKHISKLLFTTGIIVTMIFSGCTKTEDILPETPETPTAASTPSITFGDGYGVLAAVKSVSFTTVAGYTVPVEVNTAVAAFPSSPNSTAFLDAGSVSLNGKALTKSSNNAYVYQNFTDPLSFSQQSWVVSGSGSVPGITYSEDRPMPDFSGFASLPSTIAKSGGITIALGSAVSYADSVYVIIADYNNGYLLKRVGGGAADVVFSAADLSKLASGQAMMQVCPWNFKDEDFNDRKFYFVNETVYTKMGITIN